MFPLGAGCWIEGRGSCEEQQGVEEAGAEEIGNKPSSGNFHEPRGLELEDEFEPCWRRRGGCPNRNGCSLEGSQPCH